jgi:hypothetical protein
MTPTTINTTMEGIIGEIETEFPMLRESFLAGTMELTEVNAISYELIGKYQEARRSLERIPFGKVMQRSYDQRFHQACDEFREEIKQLVMIK